MAADRSAGALGSVDVLRAMHGCLDGHFRQLAEERAAAGNSPVFALEHGLDTAELERLTSAVVSSVARGSLPRDAWLPLVVFAAEIGYRYDGTEYWDSFEAAAPGWRVRFRNDLVRDRFEEFAATYRGARPGGAWAECFTIIAWPITHSVLPTDLQVHLTRLLYDYRHYLTAGMLSSPGVLGQRLAAHATRASSRFLHFTQNTELLGQVASALLMGEETHGQFLLPSTLSRIIDDLAKERQALRWLKDAKARATSVRLRGLHGGGSRGGGGSADGTEGQLPIDRLLDPRLFVRRDDRGWSPVVGLPDMSALGVRFPLVYEELQRRRCVVAGAAGAPLTRGRIVLPGQRVRLDRWPGPSEPFLKIENGSSPSNQLLASLCRLHLGPDLLFRITEPGRGLEVRGRFVRPGRQYLLMTREPIADSVDWVSADPTAIEGTFAYTMNLPEEVGPDEIAFLAEHRLSTAADIDFVPVGSVPALWDGDGVAEWLIGAEPTIAIFTSRRLRGCSVTLNGGPPLALDVSATDQGEPIFVQLDDLDPGTHGLDVSLVPLGDDAAILEGRLEITMREPRRRTSGGSYRSAFFLVASPSTPTLSDLWDDRVSLDLFGPEGVEVRPRVCLFAGGHKTADVHLQKVALPLDPNQWRDLMRTFRSTSGVREGYDDADCCEIHVNHPDLGHVLLKAEREFTPLRWVVGRDRQGLFARLIDNTGSDAREISVSTFDAPGTPRVPHVLGDVVRHPAGGLLIATSQGSRATALLPPQVNNLDDLRRLGGPPAISMAGSSADEVTRICRVAADWLEAPMPGDVFARHRQIEVRRSIAVELAARIGGPTWARAEAVAASIEPLPTKSLAAAIGDQPDQRSLAASLEAHLPRFSRMGLEERVDEFGGVCGQLFRWLRIDLERAWLAEFLLRAASEPGSLCSWCGTELLSGIQAMSGSPVLLRAARYVVLATSRIELDPDVEAPYGSWTWE
jgi:hypothetical protein